MGRWLNIHYNRILDMTLFVGYVLIGLALAYGPPADSMAFIQRIALNTDRRIVGWIFFIVPSWIYLLRDNYLFKFALLSTLAFVLSGASWFLLITPNRSWFVIVVFALALLRMLIHYMRLILNPNGHIA